MWALFSPYLNVMLTAEGYRNGVGVASGGEGGGDLAAAAHGRRMHEDDVSAKSFQVNAQDEEDVINTILGRRDMTRIFLPERLLVDQLSSVVQQRQAAEQTRGKTVVDALDSMPAAMIPRRHRFVLVVVAVRTRKTVDVVSLLRPWQKACDNNAVTDDATFAADPSRIRTVCFFAIVVPADFAPKVAEHFQILFKADRTILVVQSNALVSEGISRLHQGGFDAAAEHFKRVFRRSADYVLFTTIQFEPRRSSSSGGKPTPAVRPFLSAIVSEYETIDQTLKGSTQPGSNHTGHILGCTLALQAMHGRDDVHVLEHGIEFLLGNGQGSFPNTIHAVKRHQGLPVRDERVTPLTSSAGDMPPLDSGHRTLRNISRRMLDVSILPRSAQLADAVSPYCVFMPLFLFRNLNGFASYALSNDVYSVVADYENAVDLIVDDGGQNARYSTLRDVFQLRLRQLDGVRSSLKFSDVVSGTPAFKRAVAHCIRLCDQGIRVYEAKTSKRWRDAAALEPEEDIMRRLPEAVRPLEEKHRDLIELWPSDTNKITTVSLWFSKVLTAFENYGEKAEREAEKKIQDGLFNEESAVWDLCLRARASQVPTLVSSEAVVTIHQSPYRAALGNEADGSPTEVFKMFTAMQIYPSSSRLTGSFLSRWSSLITSTDNLLPFFADKPATQVVWYTVCCHCCGFSNEIQSLLQPLQRLVNVHSTAEPDCFCPNASRMLYDTLDRLHLKPNKVRRSAPDDIILWVSHTNPTLYHLVRELSEKADYIIGRSMYEFSRLRPNQVNLANQLADEIWVPSQFVYHSYKTSGVEEKKLVKIPEAIDTNLFNPATTETMPMPPTNMRFKCNRPVSRDARPYTFLSDFKWEPRKGWDILFEAYLGSFTPRDDVVLYVLTHIWFPGGPETYKWPYNTTFLHLEIEKFVTLNTTLLDGGRTMADMPTFCIISQELQSTEMAVLYNSVDAFVYPTRGEGWGLPPMQAMSMGKPVIATSWGGSTEFLRQENSFLIALDGVVEIPLDSVYGWELGTKWALPSKNHTGQLMRHLFTNRTHGEIIGRAARRYIVEHFSEEAVGEVLRKRIQEVRQIVLNKRAKQW